MFLGICRDEAFFAKEKFVYLTGMDTSTTVYDFGGVDKGHDLYNASFKDATTGMECTIDILIMPWSH